MNANFKKIKGSFVSVIIGIGCFLMACEPMNTKNETQGNTYYLLIGTYSPADSNGIFVYKFNTDSGKATFVSAVSGIENPSYLTLSPNKKKVYAVSETHEGLDGSVFAYSFHADSGRLEYINQQPDQGANPCYLTTDDDGQYLFVANYTSGNLSVLSLSSNGAVDSIVQNIQHHGHSVVSPNQDQAHVHCAVMSPDSNILFVTDLGLDKIFAYNYNEKTGKLTPGSPATYSVTKGSGPRMMTFSPDGKYLYLIQELGGQITTFRYDSGKLTKVQEISNLPEGYEGRIWGADIHISPDGAFLYATNRDDLNDIVTYKVNKENGKIMPVNRQPTGGKTPRYFTITPDGRYVLIGHQNGNAITIFKRNRKTGKLTMTDSRILVPHAVCLKMISVGK